MSNEDIDALIVRNLLDLERADSRITKDIQPKIGKEIDIIIGNWATENGWYQDLSFDEAVSAIAPESWRVPESEPSDDEFYATFYTDTNDDGKNDQEWSSSYWLTQLCGLGDGPVGFRWAVDFAELGAKKGEWKRFVIKNNANAALKGFGFEYQDKSGAFFLPFKIDNELLANAIKENNIEDALEPVRASLVIIIESWGLFDGIIKEFKKKI